MHPYELARVLGERGVPANRGSLYDTIEAMVRVGWVEALEPEQQGARPRRTPYALTDQGRKELAGRLDQQIRQPRREFPEFLGAISHVGVLGRSRALDALSERAERLGEQIAEDQRRLEAVLAGGEVRRLFVIEAEYALHIAEAERAWVLDVVDQIKTGQLAWPSPTVRRGRSSKPRRRAM
jgi:DNA-binding PadR family transcriptional regulator